MKLEHKLAANTKIAASTSNGPEKVRVFLVIRNQYGAIRHDHGDLDEIRHAEINIVRRKQKSS